MASVRRFQFDDSFDADSPFRAAKRKPEPAPEMPAEPPPPPAPTFSEADLEAARHMAADEGEKRGHAAGYAKGLTDGHANGSAEGREAARQQFEATLEARVAAALEKLSGGITHLLAERNGTNVMRRDQPVHIAMAVLRKVLPETARRNGLTEIEGLVRECLTELIDEPRFVVRVPEDLQADMKTRLDTMAETGGFGARLVVVGDAALGPGDCRIEWAEGGVERDTNQLLADVSVTIERLLEAPPG